MRQIHINEDLSNQTLNGPARQSYFGNCILKNTKFIGDWRGTDYIGVTGNADWTDADTYLSYWRDCNLVDSKFPYNLGIFHHEPALEILRKKILTTTNTFDKGMMQRVYDFLSDNYSLNEYAGSCLYHIYLKLKEDPNVTDAKIIKGALPIVASYGKWSVYWAEFMRDRLLGRQITPSHRPTKFKIDLTKDKYLILDKDNIPALTRPQDRYELSRLLESQAEKLTGNVTHLFVMSINPPIVRLMPTEDEWLRNRKSGY